MADIRQRVELRRASLEQGFASVLPQLGAMGALRVTLF